jgi:hypothetical protein
VPALYRVFTFLHFYFTTNAFQTAMSTIPSTEESPLILGSSAKHKSGCVPSEPSKSTRWRRAHSKPSRADKAASQQYLNPCEEKALVDYILCIANRGYPLSVKFLRSLALVIARQRSSPFQIPPTDGVIRPPGKS